MWERVPIIVLLIGGSLVIHGAYTILLHSPDLRGNRASEPVSNQ
jgi:hypothetical protein